MTSSISRLAVRRLTLAISGASGMPFARLLLQELLKANVMVNLVITKAGLLTMHQELGVQVSGAPKILRQRLLTSFDLVNPELLNVYSIDDWFAPMASGSSVDDAMVICPCSMATLAKVATGIGDDLVTRSADVIIKEQRRLVLVPRETPLSAIHLQNMLKLAQLGVTILPPVPAFYNHPQTLDDVLAFIVSRILDHLYISNELTQRW